ncbi:hypothetical protein LCGC14_2634260 [marine sediment metagenome]|uniref:Uncharacterized protein n=1 Tax=marine sediment metagenome TaxID=412755 RepID=A0A0F9CRS2_9ZZZZ
MRATDAWLVEKSEEAAYNAARLVDLLQEASLPKGVMDQLADELHPMLYNLTKIVASANRADGSWHSDVAKTILASGSDGFRQFMSRVRELSTTGKGGQLFLEKIHRARLDTRSSSPSPGSEGGGQDGNH